MIDRSVEVEAWMRTGMGTGFLEFSMVEKNEQFTQLEMKHGKCLRNW